MSLERFRQLIRIPSYSCQEGPIQAYIKKELENSKLTLTLEGDNLLLFYLKGRDQNRAFIFNSHVDVVDIGDKSQWSHGPWSAEIENGRVYGRGTCDGKAGVYATMEVAKTLAERESLPCDVFFAYVGREETDGLGTREFMEWFKSKGYLEQYKEITAVFTEPTNLDTIKYGHKGNYVLKAIIRGNTGHASRPEQIKTHAILEMSRFIADLEMESAQWKRQFQNSCFGKPTITPTAIEAKSNSSNRIPEYCEAIFDLRTIPDFHQEAFERVNKLAEQKRITISLLFPATPTGYTKPGAKIVKVLQSLLPNLKLEIFEASSDLGFLTNIGVEGIIFGPGEIDQAHTTNESIPITQVERASKLYEQLYDIWASS